eukprot:4293270-Alexandrium_andersonii.AAC.1
MQLCTFIFKHKLHGHYVSEFMAIRPHLDRALAQSFVITQGKGWEPQRFWDFYEGKAKLVVDTGLVRQLLGAE